MLIYVLRWWPSWISDPHRKQKLGKGLAVTLRKVPSLEKRNKYNIPVHILFLMEKCLRMSPPRGQILVKKQELVHISLLHWLEKHFLKT
jgi:hypothetical protein